MIQVFTFLVFRLIEKEEQVSRWVHAKTYALVGGNFAETL